MDRACNLTGSNLNMGKMSDELSCFGSLLPQSCLPLFIGSNGHVDDGGDQRW